jgi:hypothetical protein
MVKKTSLLLAAVAVLASAVPAMASAAVPTITDAAELDIGTMPTICKFTGTYVNGGDALTFTAVAGVKGSPVACRTATLDGAFTLEQGNGTALGL